LALALAGTLPVLVLAHAPAVAFSADCHHQHEH
jgi:hypothetical protein